MDRRPPSASVQLPSRAVVGSPARSTARRLKEPRRTWCSRPRTS